MQKENHFDELYDRMLKTAACRFAANDRLKAHHNVSLWTITFFSMGLIFIPLVDIFGLNSNFSPNYTSFIQVVLAIVILVISVLLNMAGFSVRAEKMHQCAMLVNNLARKTHRHINDQSNPEIYDELIREYDDVLQRFENHARIDYLYAKKHLSSHYKNPWHFPVTVRVKYFFQFTPYIFLLGLEVSWLVLLAIK